MLECPFYQNNLLSFGNLFLVLNFVVLFSHSVHPECHIEISYILLFFFLKRRTPHKKLRHGDDQTDSAAVAQGFGDCQGKTCHFWWRWARGVTVAWEQGLAISHAQLKQQVLWPRAETLHPPPPLSLTLSFSLCSFDLRPFSFFSLSCVSPPAPYILMMGYQTRTVPLILLCLSITLFSFLFFSCTTAVNGHLCKLSLAQCSETHGWPLLIACYAGNIENWDICQDQRRKGRKIPLFCLQSDTFWLFLYVGSCACACLRFFMCICGPKAVWTWNLMNARRQAVWFQYRA